MNIFERRTFEPHNLILTGGPDSPGRPADPRIPSVP